MPSSFLIALNIFWKKEKSFAKKLVGSFTDTVKSGANLNTVGSPVALSVLTI